MSAFVNVEFLPAGFTLQEDEDLVYIACRTCQHISIFSAPAATPEVLIAAAHAHTCRPA